MSVRIDYRLKQKLILDYKIKWVCKYLNKQFVERMKNLSKLNWYKYITNSKSYYKKRLRMCKRELGIVPSSVFISSLMSIEFTKCDS